jgi:hypothetical protein
MDVASLKLQTNSLAVVTTLVAHETPRLTFAKALHGFANNDTTAWTHTHVSGGAAPADIRSEQSIFL